ncbi:DUF6894 family protein [Aureimonas glaciei]|uniref:DUF6894 domain-containing protein n=1 Tax=Aureimonas glaciei TaxID=1776957 RepID=A0A917D8Z6_9HYPH|nr:hypothetical protein [Aureimonas glaciei]GGD11032.1 hypothetical protein GCM10011335_12450 [Aureimonas glaciei]
MRYFLHMRRGEELIQDPDGTELPDLDAVMAEAIQGARQILAENVMSGSVVTGRKFEICDEQGKVLLVVPFSEAVKLI